MAADQKKACRRHAYLVLIDESGLLMAPLVRRTWARRGQTPILQQRGKHREKVSVAAALWLSPDRKRLGLFYQTLVNGYFNNHRSAAFLERLMREIPERMIVVWDGGAMHKGDPIREQVTRFRPRLSLERLPPYAPMLNPVEPIWSWLKYARLCNFAPVDARQLNEAVVAELTTIRHDQESLRNFWHASDLPLPRTLLL
jgi:transposase